jgi:molybdopterin-dependent oxidoreductase alpha subunit
MSTQSEAAVTRVRGKARGWTPKLWVSRKPLGIGEQHNNSYLDILKTIWENRRHPLYAWRILTRGVCDGCSLGTTGMKDWTMDGIHLCYVRLRLLRLNTDDAVDPARLSDVAALRRMTSAELRNLGRLGHPMVRRAGEPGFSRVGWDQALDLVAARIRASTPDRLSFYMTSRGMPNEAYYAAQKAVRAMGSNSIDNAARICHSPSTSSLKQMVGVAATTCSFRDWIDSDLIVFIGSNVASNQPVAMKYLHFARKAGAKVVVVNSYREPGMERYWVPSVMESALFGTKITDRFFMVDVGGDIGFLNGAMRHMVENGWVDNAFVKGHTTGFEELAKSLAEQPWEELERASGSTRGEMLDFAKMLAGAERAVLVWSMGITQHVHGEDNVRAILNLGLSKGFVGREGCGLMPIRGHSGVQGGAEMGAYSTAFPGGVEIDPENAGRLAETWGFEVPASPGLTAPESIDAADEGKLDVLFSVGGNFLEVMPDPAHVETAMSRVPLRVHMDIVLSSQMLVDTSDTVVLLPAATRYETRGGVTETTTERRVIFSPEIPGRRVGEARPELEVLMDLARRVRPELRDRLTFTGTAAIRDEIARAVPMYDGIQHLHRQGDQFQYGGPHLCAGWDFPTADGKAHFSPVALPRREVPEGMFAVTTRRGRQFNSMVHERRDGVTGAPRDAVFMCAADAERLALRQGDPVVLRNALGELRGQVFLAPVKAGSLQVHWPEAETIIDRTRRSPVGGVPDYNAVVSVEKAPVVAAT